MNLRQILYKKEKEEKIKTDKRKLKFKCLELKPIKFVDLIPPEPRLEPIITRE